MTAARQGLGHSSKPQKSKIINAGCSVFKQCGRREPRGPNNWLTVLKLNLVTRLAFGSPFVSVCNGPTRVWDAGLTGLIREDKNAYRDIILNRKQVI